MTTKKSVSYFAFGIIPQSVLPNFFHFHRFIKVDASIDAGNSAHFTNYISATIFHYIYKISTTCQELEAHKKTLYPRVL